MIRRILCVLVVACLVIGGCLVVPLRANALATAPGCAKYGPITSGLWAGLNLATGSNYACPQGGSNNATNTNGNSSTNNTNGSTSTNQPSNANGNSNGSTSTDNSTNGNDNNESNDYSSDNSGSSSSSSTNNTNGSTSTNDNSYSDNSNDSSNYNDNGNNHANNNYNHTPTNSLPHSSGSNHSGSSSRSAPYGNSYVAMGDSVAAGQGLSGSTTATNSGCSTSSQAYPALVASTLGYSYRNVACSGATAGDLVTRQSSSSSGEEMAPQIDTAFANGTPSLITITAGANDAHWQYYIQKCYAGTCGTSVDEAATTGLLTALRLKLTYALERIQQKSGGSPPTVVVTGYYDPVSTACAGRQNAVTSSEISWIRNQTDALNRTIANTVSGYSFARYAPVDFSGHELCTSDPWVQGLQDPAPLHPTAEGQQRIAQSVLSVLHQ